MNTREQLRKLHLGGVPEGTEVLLEGDTIVLRKVVDVAKFREISADVRKHLPKRKKGASILREVNRLRIGGGDER